MVAAVFGFAFAFCTATWAENGHRWWLAAGLIFGLLCLVDVICWPRSDRSRSR